MASASGATSVILGMSYNQTNHKGKLCPPSPPASTHECLCCVHVPFPSSLSSVVPIHYDYLSAEFLYPRPQTGQRPVAFPENNGWNLVRLSQGSALPSAPSSPLKIQAAEESKESPSATSLSNRFLIYATEKSCLEDVFAPVSWSSSDRRMSAQAEVFNRTTAKRSSQQKKMPSRQKSEVSSALSKQVQPKSEFLGK